MKALGRQRAMRILLAALINSSLTVEELREVSAEIQNNRKFTADFAALLSEVADGLCGSPPQKSSASHEVGFFDAAMLAIKRRRLPRSEILKAIALAAPDLSQRSVKDDAKIRDVVKDFLSLSSPDQKSRFLTLLSPKDTVSSDDPYLRGIVGKR